MGQKKNIYISREQTNECRKKKKNFKRRRIWEKKRLNNYS